MNYEEDKKILMESIEEKADACELFNVGCEVALSDNEEEIAGQRKASDFLKYEIPNKEDIDDSSASSDIKCTAQEYGKRLFISPSVDSGIDLHAKRRSLLSEIKEKLSDKIPEKINAWMENLNSEGDQRSLFKKSFSMDSSLMGEKTHSNVKSTTNNELEEEKSVEECFTKSPNNLEDKKRKNKDVEPDKNDSSNNQPSQTRSTTKNPTANILEKTASLTKNTLKVDSLTRMTQQSKQPRYSQVGPTTLRRTAVNSTDPNSWTARQTQANIAFSKGQTSGNIPDPPSTRKLPDTIFKSRKIGLQSLIERKAQAIVNSEEEKHIKKHNIGPMDSMQNPEALNETEAEVSFKTKTKTPKPKSMFKPKYVALMVVIGLAFLIIPRIVNIPAVISGFILGTVNCYCILCFLNLFWPPKPPYKRSISIPNIESFPALRTVNKAHKMNYFTGWMNELKDYNADNFHINTCNSVMVYLDFNILILRRPKVNIPRRCMYDEVLPSKFDWADERTLNLSGARVFLVPDGLVYKRVWGKRYPICIIFDRRAFGEKDITVLYLFGRTAREKEEWFRRFKSAASMDCLPVKFADILPSLKEREKEREYEKKLARDMEEFPNLQRDDRVSVLSDSEIDLEDEEYDPDWWRHQFTPVTNAEALMDFLEIVSKALPQSCLINSANLTAKDGTKTPVLCDPQLNWFNALIARVFWDVKRNERIFEYLFGKVKLKLDRLEVPHFLDEIFLIEMDFGDQVPIIQRISNPIIDELGMWIDLDIAYNGGYRMVIDTKVNLVRLMETCSKKNPPSSSPASPPPPAPTGAKVVPKRKAPIPKETPYKKTLRLIDKFASSKFCQKLSAMPMVRDMLEEISSTKVTVVIECNTVVGNVTINFPCPPTDRIWYSFRGFPEMAVTFKPKFGNHHIDNIQLLNWMDKKMRQEFERMFVMPNMDDFPILLLDDNKPYADKPSMI